MEIFLIHSKIKFLMPKKINPNLGISGEYWFTFIKLILNRKKILIDNYLLFKIVHSVRVECKYWWHNINCCEIFNNNVYVLKQENYKKYNTDENPFRNCKVSSWSDSIMLGTIVFVHKNTREVREYFFTRCAKNDCRHRLHAKVSSELHKDWGIFSISPLRKLSGNFIFHHFDRRETKTFRYLRKGV